MVCRNHELLTEAQITAELATVPAWTRDGDSITTLTERADFRDALLYLGAVAYLAERPKPGAHDRVDHVQPAVQQWNWSNTAVWGRTRSLEDNAILDSYLF